MPLQRGNVDDLGDARCLGSQNVADGCVTALQQDLAALGFEAGAPDGAFGRDTKAAVQAFQRAAGLEPSGVVDAPVRLQLARWLEEGFTAANPPPAAASAPVDPPAPAAGAAAARLISPRVPHFSQGDPRWADRILGRGSTIVRQGCAVCCVAMVLCHHGRAVTPATVDAFLDVHDGYAGDSIKWSVAAQCAAQGAGPLRYDRRAGPESEVLAQLLARLAAGRPTLVRVDYGVDMDLTYNHFVVAVGTTAEGHVVMTDPATARGDGYASLDDNVIQTTTRKRGYRIVQLDWFDPA